MLPGHVCRARTAMNSSVASSISKDPLCLTVALRSPSLFVPPFFYSFINTLVVMFWRGRQRHSVSLRESRRRLARSIAHQARTLRKGNGLAQLQAVPQYVAQETASSRRYSPSLAGAPAEGNVRGLLDAQGGHSSHAAEAKTRSCSKCAKESTVCRWSKNSGNWYTDKQDEGNCGRVAQLGEHLLCKHAVISSNSLNRRLLIVQNPLLVGLLIGLQTIRYFVQIWTDTP